MIMPGDRRTLITAGYELRPTLEPHRVAAERWLQPEPDTTFSAMLRDALTWIAPALRAADR